MIPYFTFSVKKIAFIKNKIKIPRAYYIIIFLFRKKAFKVNKLKSVSLTVLGSAMVGFSVAVFLTPNKIVGGGVSGMATILYQVFGIAQGLTYAVINLILLLIGYKTLGRKFTLNTLLAAGLTSFFVQIFSYIPHIVDNIVLASLFGGTLFGFGLCATFIVGSSTGGTDILGRLLQTKYPNFSIGKLLMFVDGIIILISLLVFKNFELTLFGIMSLFVSSYSLDWLIKKLNISKMAFVITGKGEEIASHLVSTSPRGVTVINATGAYSQKNKSVLFCALKEREIVQFQNKILSIDPSAFIVYSESEQIMGNGFYIYR